jgi:hypothetical protein
MKHLKSVFLRIRQEWCNISVRNGKFLRAPVYVFSSILRISSYLLFKDEA